MAVTEKQRHDLFTKIEETLGPEHAATMMELLPPVGWAEVATKRDLDALRAATKADMDAFRAATEADMDAFRAATEADLDALRAATKADIGSVRADIDALRLSTKADLQEFRADLRRDVGTWLFSAMGVQTAVIGLLLAVVR